MDNISFELIAVPPPVVYIRVDDSDSALTDGGHGFKLPTPFRRDIRHLSKIRIAIVRATPFLHTKTRQTGLHKFYLFIPCPCISSTTSPEYLLRHHPISLSRMHLTTVRASFPGAYFIQLAFQWFHPSPSFVTVDPSRSQHDFYYYVLFLQNSRRAYVTNRILSQFLSYLFTLRRVHFKEITYLCLHLSYVVMTYDHLQTLALLPM